MTHGFTLGYALNAFPYEDLRGMCGVLRHDAPEIKRAVFRDNPFPIELRFSRQITDSLQSSRGARARLRALLQSGGFQVVTVNGFVPLSFHAGRVKERVYLPAWSSPRRDARSRVAFTNQCIRLLAELMEGSVPFGSVSVPAGVLKRDVPKRQRQKLSRAIATAIGECARTAFEVERRTGRRVMIGLEPEPGLTCETTTETIAFFKEWLWTCLEPGLHAYVGVNFDLCHQLVQWENPIRGIQSLRRHGIPLTKIHVTNAIQLDAPLAPASAPQTDRLRRFYARSKFLHQTVGVNARRQTVFASLDLPSVLAPGGRRELRRRGVKALRIHYHMPLFESPDSLIHTTLPAVHEFLGAWKKETVEFPELRDVPLVIETYTWLEQLRAAAANSRVAMRDGIIRELQSVQSLL